MVVCKCRKVRTYSEWVIVGEYDWPPACCQCKAVLQEGVDHQTTRLGCLHVIHTSCWISHIKTFPQHTAPAGYVCPGCSTSTGIEKNVFGNHPTAELHGPPHAFASDPLKRVSNGGREDVQSASASDIVEVDVPYLDKSLASNHEPNYIKSASPGATNSEISYFADDEDGNKKKYTWRGPFWHKFLRALLPFWSSALPTLPVTAPYWTYDTSEGCPRHHRSSRMDLRKILLVIAIMACMATMGILYYRIAQGGPGQQLLDDENVP